MTWLTLGLALFGQASAVTQEADLLEAQAKAAEQEADAAKGRGVEGDSHKHFAESKRLRSAAATMRRAASQHAAVAQELKTKVRRWHSHCVLSLFAVSNHNHSNRKPYHSMRILSAGCRFRSKMLASSSRRRRPITVVCIASSLWTHQFCSLTASKTRPCRQDLRPRAKLRAPANPVPTRRAHPRTRRTQGPTQPVRCAAASLQ